MFFPCIYNIYLLYIILKNVRFFLYLILKFLPADVTADIMTSIYFLRKRYIDRQFRTSPSFNHTCSCLAGSIINACKSYGCYKGRASLTRCNTCVKTRSCLLRRRCAQPALAWGGSRFMWPLRDITVIPLTLAACTHFWITAVSP